MKKFLRPRLENVVEECSRRFALSVKELFALQPRLEQPRGRRALRLVENPRFRAAYDLMVLRTELGEVSLETANWWTRLQTLSPDEQRQEFGGGGGRRRGPQRPDPATTAA